MPAGLRMYAKSRGSIHKGMEKLTQGKLINYLQQLNIPETRSIPPNVTIPTEIKLIT